MYVIVGLGNPSKKYDKTRHNVGFDVIDELSSKLNIDVKTRRYRSLCGIGNYAGEKVVLIKPQTYMNASGEAIKRIVSFYKLDPTKDLIVISDDINLDIGRMRIRKSGSAGGHNGLKNIIAHLKTEDFTRVRVGVGENGGSTELIKHVLGKFNRKDRAKIDEAIREAADAIECIMTDGEEAAMNKYNC